MIASSMKDITEIEIKVDKKSIVPCRVDLLKKNGRVSQGGGKCFMEAFLKAMDVGLYGQYTVKQGLRILDRNYESQPIVWDFLNVLISKEVQTSYFRHLMNA